MKFGVASHGNCSGVLLSPYGRLTQVIIIIIIILAGMAVI